MLRADLQLEFSFEATTPLRLDLVLTQLVGKSNYNRPAIHMPGSLCGSPAYFRAIFHSIPRAGRFFLPVRYQSR